MYGSIRHCVAACMPRWLPCRAVWVLRTIDVCIALCGRLLQCAAVYGIVLRHVCQDGCHVTYFDCCPQVMIIFAVHPAWGPHTEWIYAYTQFLQMFSTITVPLFANAPYDSWLQLSLRIFMVSDTWISILLCALPERTLHTFFLQRSPIFAVSLSAHGNKKDSLSANESYTNDSFPTTEQYN